MRILVTYGLPAGIRECFSNVDIEIERGISHEELLDKIAEYDALIVRSDTRVDADVLQAGREGKLKVVGRAGVGIDNIDIDAAIRFGVLVVNTPVGNIVSAAEHTFFLLGSLARRIPQAVQKMREGQWPKGEIEGTELAGKTLGIVGFGKIGRRVAQMAQALDMQVIVADRYVPETLMRSAGVTPVSFKELLRRADAVTLHVPLSPETRHLLNRDAFRVMKQGALLVNTSRGDVIDEQALLEALQEGKLGGAALDVFVREPARGNPLFELPNVIATPHIAGATKESEQRTSKAVIEEVIDYLLHGVVRHAVNAIPLGVADLRKLALWKALAEKLGAFHAGLIEGTAREIHITYSGSVLDLGIQVKRLTWSFLAAFLRPAFGERANEYNADSLARELGIQVMETTANSSGAYTGLVEAWVLADGAVHSAAATLLPEGKRLRPKLIDFDGYSMSAFFSSHMLVYENTDTPGMIGKVGTMLGRKGINIAHFHVGRKEPQGTANVEPIAMAVVNLDPPVDRQWVLQKMRTIRGVRNIKVVELP